MAEQQVIHDPQEQLTALQGRLETVADRLRPLRGHL